MTDEEIVERGLSIAEALVSDGAPELTDLEEKQLKRAKYHKAELCEEIPRNAILAGPVPLVADRSQPTWATDGETHYMNPSWTAKRTSAEIRGVQQHEIKHDQSLHSVRLPIWMERHEGTLPVGELSKIWNVACDYIINGRLVESPGWKSGWISLPEGFLLHPKYSKGTSWTAERVADELLTERVLNPPPKGPEPQRGPPTSGGDPDGRKQQQQDITDFDEKGHSAVLPSKNIDIHDPEQIQKAVDEMQERITRAEIFEKSVGGGAGSDISMVDNSDLTANLVPERQLARFIQNNLRGGRSWRRPNKRFIPNNIYMPGRNRLPGTVWVCWDSSASVDEVEQAGFRHNLLTHSARMGIDRIMVSYVDSRVHINPDTNKPWFEHRTSRGTNAHNINFSRRGGGGTSFDPIFEYLEKNNDGVNGLIYLTDGYGYVHADEPSFPVLWVTTHVAPTFMNQGQWGEVAYI